MDQFLSWLAVSMAMVAALALCAGRRWRIGMEAAVVGTTIALALWWQMLLVLLHAILALVGPALCCRYRGRWPLTAMLSLAAMVCIYGTVAQNAHESLARREALRQRYPLESLSARLAYEGPPKEPLAVEPTSSEAPPDRIWDEVDAQGVAAVPSKRRRQLWRLHHSTTDDFMQAAGFGADRMLGLYVRDYHLELPPAEPVRIEPAAPDTTVADRTEPGPLVRARRPQPHELDQLHKSGFWDFLDPDRIGYVRDRDHVAGFVPHRLTSVPTVTPHRAETEAWRLTRLQLVSLLRHETPMAYVSPHLPNMEELVDAPTRTLDPWESEALMKLRAGENLVVVDEAARIGMLGALRAARECRACHAAAVGELLGAFSYVLQPAGLNDALPTLTQRATP